MTRDRNARRHWLAGTRIRCGADSTLVTIVPDLVTCTRCRRLLATDQQTAHDTAEQRAAFLRDWRQAQAEHLHLAADEHADAYFASLTPATVARIRHRQLRALTEGETATLHRSTAA